MKYDIKVKIEKEYELSIDLNSSDTMLEIYQKIKNNINSNYNTVEDFLNDSHITNSFLLNKNNKK